ncbi:hypothetical protein [Nonomuraea sp. LPB2021202275-12-8]|uniref:hypothetical protein n=1 Tax=Nonomuraea sp. LPB2021202275-12-8 TaxID=3120159 RepID=UPI00300C8678
MPDNRKSIRTRKVISSALALGALVYLIVTFVARGPASADEASSVIAALFLLLTTLGLLRSRTDPPACRPAQEALTMRAKAHEYGDRPAKLPTPLHSHALHSHGPHSHDRHSHDGTGSRFPALAAKAGARVMGRPPGGGKSASAVVVPLGWLVLDGSGEMPGIPGGQTIRDLGGCVPDDAPLTLFTLPTGKPYTLKCVTPGRLVVVCGIGMLCPR